MGQLVTASHRKAGRSRARWRWPLVAVAALALSWAAGLAIFAQTLPRQAATGTEQPETIVVLTGGSARVRTGLELLSADQGEELFVTGVHERTELAQILRQGKDNSEAALGEDALSCCITLDRKARNTAGNARETAAWLARNDIDSIRLVTSAYHMPRALLEFRMAAPGVRVLAHPVEASHVHLETWWQWPGTSRLLVTEYNKYLVTLARYIGAQLGSPGPAAQPA